jgi:hypothetical protein
MTGWNSAASSVSPLNPSDETLDIRQLENGLERPGAHLRPTTAPLASLAGIDALVGVLRHGILGTISATAETENTSECQEDVWLINQDSNHDARSQSPQCPSSGFLVPEWRRQIRQCRTNNCQWRLVSASVYDARAATK